MRGLENKLATLMERQRREEACLLRLSKFKTEIENSSSAFLPCCHLESHFTADPEDSMTTYLQEMEGLEKELESLSKKKTALQELLASSSPEALREKYRSDASTLRSLTSYNCCRWHAIECELKVKSGLSVEARLAAWDEKLEGLEQRSLLLQEELQHHQRIYQSDKTSLEKLFGSKREGIVPLYYQFSFKSDISSIEEFLTALHLIMGT